MSNALPNPSRRGGFTLVELITVIAVLGILVILVVGAVKGVQNHVAHSATREVFEAIEAALQQYYNDWGKYPWNQACSADSDFAQVGVEYAIPATGDEAEATLYAALNARLRHGPYFRGSAAAAQKRVASGRIYFVFVDGWGRKITYAKPSPETAGKPPILTSTGADEFDDTDDIKNYTDH
jgi:prepilin-type N-terminal cleavage/methylation domain-containing protein